MTHFNIDAAQYRSNGISVYKFQGGTKDQLAREESLDARLYKFAQQYSPSRVETGHSKAQFKMKKYQDKAIPLIFRTEGKGKSGGQYEANPQALAFLRSIEGKVAVISVAGMYRTGKSYLLNTIMLNQKGGFAVGPTTNPKTKGIWVWGRPLIYKNDKDEMINVLVMDSEGLGSTEEDANHDLRLFSITLLLSSIFLYNTMGAIDEPAIDSLGVVLRICDHLRSDDYNDFPDFYWVLRDFSLALVGRDNKPLTPNKYLENSLSIQQGDAEQRNRIRQIIHKSFTNRTCFTFVRPLTNEQQLQKLDSLELDQLRPEFTEQVLEFRKMIAANIKTKKIKGKEMSAGLMVELIKVYLSEINNKKVPEIQTGWKYVCQRECESVLETVEREADQICNRIMDSLPATRKELAERQESLMEQLGRLFDSKTLNNDQAEHYRSEISKLVARRMERIEEEMRVKNAQETKAFIKKEFQNIQRRLKAGQFKSMGELVKEYEMFYEYYRKKCPYKDEVQTGLQFLMKKFSDCSLLMFKNFKAKRDQELSRLKQQADKYASETATRQQRQKHERTAAADRSAILQSRIEELMRQNRELSQALTRAEGELQRLKSEGQEKASQLGEEMEYELITLRKKLLQAEDQFKEIDCKRILEVNNIKNSLVLKQNELAHFQEAMAAQAARANTTIKELQLDREEKDKRIEELSAITERMKEEGERMKKTMQERVRDKAIDVAKLEQALQGKCNELTQIFQRKDHEMRLLRESFDLQKANIAENYKEQMRAVQQAQQAELQERAMRLRKSESDMAQRQMQLKMHRLQVDKEAAILMQKIQFLKQECSDKEARLNKLQQQNSYYVNIFEEKDSQLSSISILLEDQRAQLDANTQELSLKLTETTQTLADRAREVLRLEENQERLKAELKEKEQELKYLSERLKTVSKGYEEKLKQVSERLAFEVESAQKSRQALQAQIDLLRTQNSKSTEEQKRNIELSLVQLKNYYEMERQRLQKKNLQNRKKHQQSQSNALTELENKHRKAQRALQDQIQQLRTAKESLEEQITRMENDFDIKTMAAEEERENEKRMLMNRLDLLQKKYSDLQEQYDSYERSSEEERISFVKRVEGLNFELSRKEKELMQVASKRDSLESSLKKRETQFENVKRMMTQEVEGSLKKVSEIQTKYQKLNEEYMQYKIESDKEIALCRQRNEFLTIKLQEATRDRESASSKNIERLDKQKLADLKEQLEKCKAELIALETKNQGLRRSLKEQEAVALKKIATLQKEKEFLEQKEAISQAKVTDLQAKVQQKSELFAKDLDQAKGKYAGEKTSLQKQCEQLREKLRGVEDSKEQESWRLEKDIMLLNERIKYLEYQKDQIQREREDSEKRLQMALEQIKKSNEKLTEDSQSKRNQNDKRYVGQIQSLRENFRQKQADFEQSLRRYKQQAKTLRDKNQQLQQRLQAQQKLRAGQKSYQQQIESLKREKENLMMNYRNERAKDTDEWKRKNNQLDRKCKELEKKNLDSIFALEKDNSKWSMERDQLLEKIKQLEDSYQWERNKNQLNKSKSELKRSESGNIFSATSGAEFRSFGNWK